MLHSMLHSSGRIGNTYSAIDRNCDFLFLS